MPVLQEIKVPLLSVNDTYLTVVSVLFKKGETVRKGDIVMVFETSKTTYDVPAEADGYIAFECQEGAEYAVNEVVARIYSVADEIPASPIASEVVRLLNSVYEGESRWAGETLFSKAAKRLMETHGLDESGFSGMDFVSRADVEERLGKKSPPSVSLKPRPSLRESVLNVQEVPQEGSVKVEKISKNKAREIEYLSEVQSVGLTSTINVQVDTSGVFEAANPSFRYLKNSLLPLVIYEVSRLLPKYPALNAYYTEGQIAYYQRVVPGFAIDVDKGLKVVAIPDAGEMELAGIEQSIFSLSEKYLEDRLDFSDLSGITFTITDLSAEGVHSFIPLVNRMNSAILGVSSVDVKTGYCMLSLTFDHRVTEGRNASVFLRELSGRLASYAVSRKAAQIGKVSCHKCLKSLKDDITGTGFVQCITPQGEQGYICQSCLNGF